MSTESRTTTVTDNYIDVKHSYYGLPNDEGLRVRTVDVWFATRPSPPEYGLVDPDDQIVGNQEAKVSTAWCIEKAGLDRIYIYDRDDIAGLRMLLDRLDEDFDRRDMEALHAAVEVDNQDDSE